MLISTNLCSLLIQSWCYMFNLVLQEAFYLLHCVVTFGQSKWLIPIDIWFPHLMYSGLCLHALFVLFHKANPCTSQILSWFLFGIHRLGLLSFVSVISYYSMFRTDWLMFMCCAQSAMIMFLRWWSAWIYSCTQGSLSILSRYNSVQCRHGQSSAQNKTLSCGHHNVWMVALYVHGNGKSLHMQDSDCAALQLCILLPKCHACEYKD